MKKGGVQSMSNAHEVSSAMRICINPEAIAPPTGAPDTPYYSWVVRKGPMVFLAGMAPYDRDKNLIGTDLRGQAWQAMANLRTGIESVGGTLADICAITVYVPYEDLQRDVYPALNSVVYEFFPTEPPARAVVGGVALPRREELVQIVATGVLEA
jgi:2-iminobutanoate/2-iminopropanoate deaminase